MVAPHTQVHADKIADLLEILQKERGALALSRREIFASKWLGVLGLKVIPWLLLILLGTIVLEILFRFIDVFWFLIFAVALVGLVLIALGAAAILFAPFTVSILLKDARQRRAMRRIGLADQFQEIWAEKRRERRLGWRVLLAVVVFFSAAAWILVVWLRSNIRELEGVSGHRAFAFFFALCLVPAYAWEAERSRQRLEILADLERLRALVSRSAASSPTTGSGETVALPPEALRQIARIEQAQIARDRVETLYDARGSAVSAYAVLKSPEVQGILRSLELATRLQLEERIQDLSSDSNVIASAGDYSATIRREPVPDTSLSLLYQVDGRTRRITVVGIDDARTGPAGANCERSRD